MPTEPLATVLVAAHNAGPYLAAAIDSALTQTFSDLELIVVDDGSTDGCVESIALVPDSRLRIFRQKQKGAPAALNAGLQQARGVYVAFLDHDDLWHPEKLAAHVRCLSESGDRDLTFDWSRVIDENGRDLGLPTRTWGGAISYQQLVADFVIGNTSAIVVRKSALDRAGPLNESLRFVYDVDLCWRIAALREDNCCSVPQYLTLYRRHPGQMSRNWTELMTDWQRLLQLAAAYERPPGARLLQTADSNMRRYLAALASEAGDSINACKLVISALYADPAQAPFDARNWLVLAGVLSRGCLPRSVFESLAAWGSRKFWRRN